jgi:hypothetical protein
VTGSGGARSGSSPRLDGTNRLNEAFMGFNATRRYRDKKTVDIALLVAAILIVLGLLAWVFAAGGS